MIEAAILLRVSTDEQSEESQLPDLERFAKHRGYSVVKIYRVQDSAWKNGGGPEYQATIKEALGDAYRGHFSVLLIWALDRFSRGDIKDVLALLDEFAECGCAVVSFQEPWLNGSAATTRLLTAIWAWIAHEESKRRSERIKMGLAARKAAGFALGRPPGAKDRKPRKPARTGRRVA